MAAQTDVQDDEQTHYTTGQVADLAGTSADNIRRLNSKGRMPAGESRPAKPHGGRRLMFPREAIDEWLPTRAQRGRPRKAQP